ATGSAVRGRAGREICRHQGHAAGQISRRRCVRRPGQFVVCRYRQRLDLLSPTRRQARASDQLQSAGRLRSDLRAAGYTLDGKLYLTTRHRGILTYDPKTKKLETLVYTWRNQLFKGPNDLDFDAEGNLYFTDPWATGPGPNASDRSGAVYQYSKDGTLRKIIDDLNFPNDIAVS